MTGLRLLLVVIGLASIVSGLPPEPTPTPSASPPITFGHTLDPDTYLVTNPTSRFEPGDPFAYSVNPRSIPGCRTSTSRSSPSGPARRSSSRPTAQRLLPEPASFGYETTTNDLIELFGYGRFTMRITLDPAGPVYAQGRFEVAEPALPR